MSEQTNRADDSGGLEKLARAHLRVAMQGEAESRDSWSAEQINSALCGHLIVTWAMLVNLLGLFTGNKEAIPGMAFAVFALTAAWLLPRFSWLSTSIVVFTAGSWLIALYWAVRL